MDDQSKRMLLLGRQAPPKELDLRLEPRTHVSPHHAPVADVVYRVEKHLSISSPKEQEKLVKASFQRTIKAQTEEEKLSEFQKKVKLRAAKVQKEMRSVSTQWQKEKQLKRACFARRQEYARKLAASNCLKSGRESHCFYVDCRIALVQSKTINESMQAQEVAAIECSSDNDSDYSSISDIDPESAPRQAEYRCGSSPSASPSRNHIEQMAEISGLHARPLYALAVQDTREKCGVGIHSQQQAASVQAERRVPLPCGAVQAVDTDFATSEGISGSAVVPTCVDMPVPPPAHVTAQVYAWQKQEQLYRGAAWPCVVSDDTELSLSGLTEMVGRLKPMHGAAHHNLLQLAHAPGDQASKLHATDSLSHRDSARKSLLRHCSPIRRTSMRLESERSQSPLETILQGGASCPTTYRSPTLDRVAGGGTGLPATSPHPGFGLSGAMQHEAITALTDSNAEVAGIPGTPSPVDHAPSAQVPRHTTETVVANSVANRRSEKRILSASMLARLVEKVKQMNLSLPQLCACHDVPVLNPAYTSHCACNCRFYQNDGLYFEMLHGLLQAYGVAV